MTDGNVEEEVVVIGTDIKAPTATAFAKVTGQTLNARDLDDGVDADGDGTLHQRLTPLSRLIPGTSAAVNLRTGQVGLLPHSRENATTLTFDVRRYHHHRDRGRSLRGQPALYNGAMGTYQVRVERH